MDDGATGLHWQLTLSDRWLVPSLQVRFISELLDICVYCTVPPGKRCELCDGFGLSLTSISWLISMDPLNVGAICGRVCNLWTAAELEVAGKVIPLCKG